MPVVEYEHLSFRNGYIYRECEVPLKNQGLVLLRGLNIDDGSYLGAGKSSIFEVFSQLQIGKGGKKDLRKGSFKSAMVNEYVGDGFEARLKIRVDGRPYEIVQYRQHSKFGNKIWVVDRDSGANVVPKDAARAPHKWIREVLLGTDETTFFNQVYMAQEFNNVMVHGTEAARRSRLTAMFNLDVYDSLYKLAGKSISMHTVAAHDMERVEAELQGVNQELIESPSLENLEADLQVKDAELEEIQQTVNSKMSEFTELSEKEFKVRQRHDFVVEVRRKFAEGQFGSDVVNPKEITPELVEELKVAYDNTYAEYITSKNKLESISKRRIIESQLAKYTGRGLIEVQEELSEAKAQVRYLQNTELPQAEARAEVATNIQRIAVSSLPLDSLETEYQESFIRETDLKNGISSLSSQLSEAVCPTCKRPYDLGKRAVSKLQAELEAKRSELDDISKYVYKLKTQIAAYKKYLELKTRLDSFSTTRSPEDVQKDCNSWIGKERALTAELERSKQRVFLESQLRDLPVETEVDLRETVSRLRKLVTMQRAQHTAASAISGLIDKIVRLPKGNLEEIVLRVAQLRAQLDKSSSILSVASAKLSKLTTAVDNLRRLLRRKRKLEDTMQKRDFILKELKALEALKKSFSPTGLKQDRFHAILTDAVEQTVPAYSNVLWPYRNIKLGISEDSGSVQFHMERTGTPLATNSSQLSGGERHKAGLAFLFGMRDLKETYTGTSSNVLIVDEPFGGLDPQGTESLVSLFELLKQRFSSIFVISHRPEVLRNPVWDQTWWAIRKDNNATLYTTTPPPAEYLKLADELVNH